MYITPNMSNSTRTYMCVLSYLPPVLDHSSPPVLDQGRHCLRMPEVMFAK